MVAPNTTDGAHVLPVALSDLGHLGVLVVMHKTKGPSIVVTFLGILNDTESFELRLPTKKVQHLHLLIRGWIQKQSYTRKELELLLNHLANCIDAT